MQNITEQQWEPVILNKKKPTNISQNKSKIEQSGGQQIEKMEKEIAKQKKVSEILRKNIQIARLNKKLTQKQWATQSGVDVKTVNMIEAGTAIFNDNEIRKLEKIIGKVVRK